MSTTHRAKLRHKGQLTLPSAVRKALHVEEHDDVEFTVTESGEVLLRGLTEIPSDQRWFWTPEWQAGEHAASAQIAAGEGTYFDDEDVFLDYLGEPDPELGPEQEP